MKIQENNTTILINSESKIVKASLVLVASYISIDMVINASKVMKQSTTSREKQLRRIELNESCAYK